MKPFTIFTVKLIKNATKNIRHEVNTNNIRNASKQIDKAAYQYLSHYKEHYGIVALPDINSLQTGGIIGAVELIGCVPSRLSKSVWADNSGFCFQLRNPVAYRKTIPCKGKLSFFDTPMVDELQIEHAVALQKIYNVPFK